MPAVCNVQPAVSWRLRRGRGGRAVQRAKQRRTSCAAAGVLPDEVVAPLPWDEAFCKHFLANYWQRRPLLIRQAVPNFCSPLSADELAGLACGDAPSRILLERGGSKPWELRRGPFDEADFASLPETHWTMIVNGVDRAVPHVADALLPLFSFLPSWRLDDIQVSYAPGAGSTVGAHSDQYDVMLLQSDGRKEWAISTDTEAYGPLKEDAFVPGLDVAVLKAFVAEKRFTLVAGDMLYLPPAVAHHGVALDEGFTYSIGFLAPSRRELFLSWASSAADADPRAAERWSDPWLTPAVRPGQLSGAAVDAAQALIASLPSSRADIAAWFGCHVTTPRGGCGQDPQPLEERPEWSWVVTQALEAGELCRHESSRFAFLPAAAIDTNEACGGILFADGRSFRVAESVAAAVAAEVADCRTLAWTRLLELGVPDAEPRTAQQQEVISLLQALLHEGLLFIPSDADEDEDEDEQDERVEVVDLEDEGDNP